MKLLDGMGVDGEAVEANANVSAYDTLIIGKGALTLQGAAPNLGARSGRPQGGHLREIRRGARKTTGASASRSMGCAGCLSVSPTIRCWPALREEHLRTGAANRRRCPRA